MSKRLVSSLTIGDTCADTILTIQQQLGAILLNSTSSNKFVSKRNCGLKNPIRPRTISFVLIFSRLLKVHNKVSDTCRVLQTRWNLSKFPHVPSANIANSRSSWFLGIISIQFLLERNLFLDASAVPFRKLRKENHLGRMDTVISTGTHFSVGPFQHLVFYHE